ncbi:MAG TPA: hypothetical protein VNK82_10775 [Terriglobales bacterium]|nr:hypothetical protein [Terriglobales bacterium]
MLVVLFLGSVAPRALAQEGPAIQKDSLLFTAYTLAEYRGNYDMWSWLPKAEFRVNGPIESGDQLFVEVTLPGRGVWVKFDCETEETPQGRSMKTKCGGRDGIPEEKSATYVGPVSFAIKLRNPLSEGGVKTLFTGKAKVMKSRSNEHGPKALNKFVYYVDHDWTLPAGYIYLSPETHGWNLPLLKADFWVRGVRSSGPGEPPQPFSTAEPHLLYKGKEVGLIFLQDLQVGSPSCSGETIETTRSVADNVPQAAKWTRVTCTFYSVAGWDKTGEDRSPRPGKTGRIHVLSDNPGEYELKILTKGRLARSLKFTVGDDGKIVDNGIATANKLGSDKIIVPVTFIGAPDGVWDKLAWKTWGYYGNPLTGFTPAP